MEDREKLRHVGIHLDPAPVKDLSQIVGVGAVLGQPAIDGCRCVRGVDCEGGHALGRTLFGVVPLSGGGIGPAVRLSVVRHLAIHVEEEDPVGGQLGVLQRRGLCRSPWVPREHPPLRLAVKLRQPALNQLGQQRVRQRPALGQVLLDRLGRRHVGRDGLLQDVLRVYRHQAVLLGEHRSDLLVGRAPGSQNHRPRDPRRRRLLPGGECRPHRLHHRRGLKGRRHRHHQLSV
mmetsp:Transcript_28915/g.86799  ORF Transcript_28915/g.86799 Transcript_28915/m.86799 type:complete len:232 (-) Transcript_28915:747-1442(-)